MNYSSCFPLALALTLVGCGSESDNSWKPPAAPVLAQGQRTDTTTFATTMPGPRAQDWGDIAVEIRKAEIEPTELGLAGAPPGHYLLTLLVRIQSEREGRLPLVEPRRFKLHVGGGREISPRFAATREPALGSRYLKTGDSIDGWLTFEVPEEAEELVLKSDLDRPPIVVAVPMPRKAPR